MIEINNVSFSYKASPILKDVSLRIKEGECVLVCGKSGSGKTTLTKLINGLIPHFVESAPYEGTVMVDGLDVKTTKLHVLADKVGSVFQNPKSQFFYLDSDAELSFGLENQGVDREEILKRLEGTTQMMDIEHLRKRHVFKMSAGEKQSLAFSGVYAMAPKVYVLDEPTANLDVYSIDILRKQLERIKSKGHTIVIAEHRLSFLMSVVDRVIYMDEGAIKNEYNKGSFLALTDHERQGMGLRTLSEVSPKVTEGHQAYDYVVENLAYKIGKDRVFEGISFGVSAGEILGITGGNGKGKSTLLRVLAGLLKEDSGRIVYKDSLLKKRQRLKKSFLVMQDVNHQLFSDSVWDECLLSNDDDAKVAEVLKALELLGYKERHPMALSGGQKQRLAIGTGLLSDRAILLFDEPTSGLDLLHMMKVSHLLRKIADEGHIVIVVTHDLEFIDTTCDRVFKM